MNFRQHGLILALTLPACTGQIMEEGAIYRGAELPTGSTQPAANPPGVTTPAPDGGTQTPLANDVNRVDLHRLNNNEYDHTVRDLLGVTSTPAATFIADEKALGFDSIAAALGMTDAQYEQYFNAADTLVDQTFADAALRARIVTCTESDACTRQITAQLGKRAYRRPLAPSELDKLAAIGGAARDLGESFDGSIAQIAKALLSSPSFLYRVELDPDPSSTVGHALSDYELASRLSYLLWSTLPDDTLFGLAERGELQRPATLTAQLDRMLDDPRADAFVASFAGQWLGLRDLENHQVEPTVFPEWNEGLRSAMVREGQLYFEEFLHKGRSVDDFFTAEVHFVDAALAELYGLTGVKATSATRVDQGGAQRKGFLGLAGFLTVSSFSYRTAPTLRGKWVLENLLCQVVPPPPPNVPELDESAAKGGGDLEVLNVRERLALHRENPACASCHTVLDPIGLGLEGFDAIGRYRTQYGANEPVDASGTLPNGTSFDGLPQLAEIMAADTRFDACVSEKLLTYALSRQIVASDKPYLTAIRDSWQSGDKTLSSLLRTIVQSDLFRMRRGEATK